MSSFNTAQTMEKKESTSNGIKRMIFVVVSMVLEVLVIVCIFFWLNIYAKWLLIVTQVLGTVLAIYIYNLRKNSALKMPWMILIMIFPVFALTLYALIGMSVSTKDMKERYREIDQRLFPYLPQNQNVAERLAAQDKKAANITRYIHARAGYPVYENTDVEYYDDAALGLEAQKEELRQAAAV